MNIYEIPDRYNEMAALLEESDEESLHEAVDNAIDEIKDDLKSHAEYLAKILININGYNAAAKMEIERLKDLIALRTRGYNSMKNAIRKAMIELNVNKIQTETSVMSLRAGSKVVEIVDESKLDPQYLNVEVISKPIKADIKKAIQAGDIEPDIAKIVTNEKSLTIK